MERATENIIIMKIMGGQNQKTKNKQHSIIGGKKEKNDIFK